MRPRTYIAAAVIAGALLWGGCATDNSTPVTGQVATHIPPQVPDNLLPPLPTDVYSIFHVDIPPHPVRQVPPIYPAELRDAGATGKAMIVFVVRPDGSVADGRVWGATNPEFGAAALQAIEQWHYEPARLDGKPVACRMSQPITFAINPM